jgi:hypothetical protein
VNTDRVQAAMEVFKAEPGIKVVGQAAANWNRQKALEVTETMLAKNPKVTAIWASDDDMALGAEQALIEKGVDGVWILGGAGMTDIIKRVMNKDPMFPGNITYPPSMIATGMELAAGVLVGGKREEKMRYMPQHSMIDVDLVTPENAAKYYFLDTRWPDGYDALVSEVEEARRITFDEPVEVKELEASEYAAQLFRSTMDVNEAGEAELAGAWRALGVLTGPLDTTALGLTAAAEAPAFYDPSSSTIYVIRELPPDLHRFAVQRALAEALLDQEFGWGDRVQDSSAAVARGTAALYDADALAVADSLLDTDERVAVLAQQRALVRRWVPRRAVGAG